MGNDPSQTQIVKATYEFLIPSHIHVIDPTPWEPLRLYRQGFTMNLQKPLVGQTGVPLKETVGNEQIDLGYSIMRVVVEIENGQPLPEWYVPFQAVKECLTWIRVSAGQYWLGVLTGSGSNVARGSIIAEDGSYTNFGGYATPIITHPLSQEMWVWIGGEMTANHAPSIPDSFFADALLSFHEQDWMQTVIRLGVVCELEVNALIDDLLSLHDKVAQDLYDEKKFRFDDKLRNVLPILGADRYQDHNQRWANELCRLYALRGAAMHRAECLIEDVDPATKQRTKVPAAFSHASIFVFAVQDFLAWAKMQRAKRGLAVVMPPNPPLRAAIGGP